MAANAEMDKNGPNTSFPGPLICCSYNTPLMYPFHILPPLQFILTQFYLISSSSVYHICFVFRWSRIKIFIPDIDYYHCSFRGFSYSLQVYSSWNSTLNYTTTTTIHAMSGIRTRDPSIQASKTALDRAVTLISILPLNILLIWSSNPHKGLRRVLFPSVISFFISPIRATCPIHSIR
jgi:hypothetical protein